MSAFRSMIIVGAVAGPLLACSDGSPSPDATVDTGIALVDTGPPLADTGGMNTCTASPPACATPAVAAGVTSGCYTATSSCHTCPSLVDNSPTLGNFRIVQLMITAPRGLANMVALRVLINNDLAAGSFLWGITLDYAQNTLRTGALNMLSVLRGTVGQGVLDATYAYHESDAPRSTGDAGALDPARWNAVTAPLSMAGDAWACSPFAMPFRVPVYNPPTDAGPPAILTELPLTGAYLHDVRLSPDRNCIGVNQFTAGRYNECTGGRWEQVNSQCRPWGVIEADITVAQARAVAIPDLHTTLCNILAGVSGTGSSSCEGMPQTMWPNQPDTAVNGEPAYHLRADFAAIGANIRNAR